MFSQFPAHLVLVIPPLVDLNVAIALGLQASASASVAEPHGVHTAACCGWVLPLLVPTLLPMKCALLARAFKGSSASHCTFTAWEMLSHRTLKDSH